jgi:hypothetical protein
MKFKSGDIVVYVGHYVGTPEVKKGGIYKVKRVFEEDNMGNRNRMDLDLPGITGRNWGMSDFRTIKKSQKELAEILYKEN